MSDDNLLSKCLHGSTQNVNEALNKIIWNKCPKQVFVERKMLKIGVYFAILEYNDGAFGIQNVLKRFNVVSGVCLGQGSLKINLKSVNTSKRKSSDEGKRRRKTIRKIKKGFLDKDKEIEVNESYVSGGF